MKLAAKAHEKIEAFHRSYSKDEGLSLPAVYVYEGSFSRWLTHKFQINAITFGRRVFVNPDLVKDDEGVRRAPAWLIAHETVALPFASRPTARIRKPSASSTAHQTPRLILTSLLPPY